MTGRFKGKCIALGPVRIYPRQTGLVAASLVMGWISFAPVHEYAHALAAMLVGMNVEKVDWAIDGRSGQVVVSSWSSPLNNALVLAAPYLLAMVVAGILFALAFKLNTLVLAAFPMPWLLFDLAQGGSEASDLAQLTFWLSSCTSQALPVVYMIVGALFIFYVVGCGILSVLWKRAVVRAVE